MIISKAMFPVGGNFAQIQRMQQQLSDLQIQLGTGKKANTLADMGNTRSTSLTLRGSINTLTGHSQSIQTVDLRLTMMDQTVSNLNKMQSEARTSSTPGGYGTNDINLTTAPTIARSRLDQVVEMLNTDINGRYLFGGNITDQKPVATTAELLEGTVGKAGYKTVAAQRLAADQGPVAVDGTTTGRIDITGSGTAVTLTEDGDHIFGMKLATIVPSGAAMTFVGPTTPAPAQLDMTFATQPVAGETVQLGFTMPDGSTEGLTLKAVTGTPGVGEYQIGVDEAATAANFQAALTTGIQKLSASTLAGASAYAAADNFFNGQGETVLRVDGPPYDTATGTIAATDTDTVMWYRGGTDDPARSSVNAKIDDNTVVNYGVQSNEAGIVELVTSLAVMSSSAFLPADDNVRAKFDAVAGRQLSRLSESTSSKQGSLEVIAVELGMARVTVNGAADRQTNYEAQLADLLDSVEGVSNEEVATQLLAMKTRLEATYSVTSMVSQLSLVNYMK